MGKHGQAPVPRLGAIAEGYFLTNFFTVVPIDLGYVDRALFVHGDRRRIVEPLDAVHDAAVACVCDAQAMCVPSTTYSISSLVMNRPDGVPKWVHWSRYCPS